MSYKTLLPTSPGRAGTRREAAFLTRRSHSIYLGKLGNYDEYFPCEFIDGNWWLAKNGQICLLDRTDNSRQNGSSCLKPIFKGNALSIKDDTGNLAYHAILVKGYALPFG